VGVDSERKLRFACGVRGTTVEQLAGVEIALSWAVNKGSLLLADGTTLRGGGAGQHAL